MSIYAKQIEETVEEIFEPLEDDQCEDCEVNFQATKMIMTEAICSAIQQAVAEERNRIKEKIWQIREDARNDGQIQHIACYDNILSSLDTLKNN